MGTTLAEETLPFLELKNKDERMMQMVSATLSPCAPFTFSTNVSQVQESDHPTPTSLLCGY